MTRSVRQQVHTRQRQARAIELRLEGRTYASIAKRVGYAGPSAAWKAVQRGVREIGQDKAQELAILQQERLNDLLAETWPIATDITHPKCMQAIERTLKIMDQMNRLAGLLNEK